MSQDTAYQEAYQKGERFYAKSNFPLAKKEFEKAWQLQPNEELRAKIQLCAHEVELQKRKETIKQARRLEKRGKFHDALKRFEQAAALQEEDWLVQKISMLQDRLQLAKVESQIERAEASQDLDATLAAYDQALAVSDNPELIAKQGIALVRAGHYDQALDLFTEHPPGSDTTHYHVGYAYARTGQFVKALEHWNAIEDVKDPALWQHYETLLPFVYHELDAGADPNGYAVAYQSVQKLMYAGYASDLTDYEHYFKYKYIEVLWKNECYADLEALLLPLPNELSLPLLGLYARVYYQLSEHDMQHLEMAITLWLTAIYNECLLQDLSIYEVEKERLDLHAVRQTLLQDMEARIQRYDRQSRLPARTLAHWQLEKRLIHALASLPLDHGSLDIFPCTPVFAEKFGLSEAISTCLRAQRAAMDEQGETFFEVSAYYSKAGPSLVLMEQGEAEQALALLPRNVSDEVSAYCRQRILFRYAMHQAARGEKQTRRWFLEALPLLQQYDRYLDELVAFAMSDLEDKAYAGLAEAMEALCKHITTPAFLKAAAYVMTIQAIQLRNAGMGTSAAEKLFKRALHMDPESELAKTSLRSVQKDICWEQVERAMKQQNLMKAATLLEASGEPELIDLFFRSIELLYEHVQNWDRAEKREALREFYAACYRLDRDHDLTSELGFELERWE
jgi:tetratricopeptide (TPR) repeat protein